MLENQRKKNFLFNKISIFKSNYQDIFLKNSYFLTIKTKWENYGQKPLTRLNTKKILNLRNKRLQYELGQFKSNRDVR